MVEGALIQLRQPRPGKPHLFKYAAIWDCGMAGTVRGFGWTALEAYSDWRTINVAKKRIEDDPTKWPLPCARDDRRGGSRC